MKGRLGNKSTLFVVLRHNFTRRQRTSTPQLPRLEKILVSASVSMIIMIIIIVMMTASSAWVSHCRFLSSSFLSSSSSPSPPQQQRPLTFFAAGVWFATAAITLNADTGLLSNGPIPLYTAVFKVVCESSSVSWSSVDGKCASFGQGWRAASVNAAAVNAAIAAKTSQTIYTGASDDANEGTWKWRSGRLAGVTFYKDSTFCQGSYYCNWEPSEPNNLFWAQHYGTILSSSEDSSRRWDDAYGSSASCYACERSPCSITLDCNAANTKTVDTSRYYEAGEYCGCVCKDGYSGPRCDDIAPTVNVRNLYLAQFMVQCSSTALSWTAAATACSSRGNGWALATINNASAHTAIASLSPEHLWLGATDTNGPANEWRWTSGRLKDTLFYRGRRSGASCAVGPCACEGGAYCNFDTTQPSGDDYLQMYATATSAARRWNDLMIGGGSTIFCYACERSPCADVTALASAGTPSSFSSYYPDCTRTATATVSASASSTPLTPTRTMMTIGASASLTASDDSIIYSSTGSSKSSGEKGGSVSASLLQSNSSTSSRSYEEGKQNNSISHSETPTTTVEPPPPPLTTATTTTATTTSPPPDTTTATTTAASSVATTVAPTTTTTTITTTTHDDADGPPNTTLVPLPPPVEPVANIVNSTCPDATVSLLAVPATQDVIAGLLLGGDGGGEEDVGNSSSTANTNNVNSNTNQRIVARRLLLDGSAVTDALVRAGELVVVVTMQTPNTSFVDVRVRFAVVGGAQVQDPRSLPAVVDLSRANCTLDRWGDHITISNGDDDDRESSAVVAAFKRVLCRLPASPRYVLTGPETVAVSVVSASTTRMCGNDAWPAGTFVIHPAEQSAAVVATGAVTTAATSVAVSIVVIFAEGSPIEIQLMVLLLGSVCGSGADAASVAVVRFFVSPFVAFGPAWMAIGNVLLALAVAILHCCVGCCVHLVVARSASLSSLQYIQQGQQRRNPQPPPRHHQHEDDEEEMEQQQPQQTPSSDVDELFSSRNVENGRSDNEESYNEEEDEEEIVQGEKGGNGTAEKKNKKKIDPCDSSTPAPGVCRLADTLGSLMFPGVPLAVAQVLYAGAAYGVAAALIASETTSSSSSSSSHSAFGSKGATTGTVGTSSMRQQTTKEVLFAALLGIPFVIAVPVLTLLSLRRWAVGVWYERYDWTGGIAPIVPFTGGSHNSTTQKDHRALAAAAAATAYRRVWMRRCDFDGDFSDRRVAVPLLTVVDYRSGWWTRVLVQLQLAALPDGRWGPATLTRPFSGILGGFRVREELWSLMPLALSVAAALLLTVLPAFAGAGCENVFVAVAMLAFVVSVLVLLLRPHRSLLGSLLTALCLALLGGVAIAQVLAVQAPGADWPSALKTALVLTLAVLSMIRSCAGAGVWLCLEPRKMETRSTSTSSRADSSRYYYTSTTTTTAGSNSTATIRKTAAKGGRPSQPFTNMMVQKPSPRVNNTHLHTIRSSATPPNTSTNPTAATTGKNATGTTGVAAAAPPDGGDRCALCSSLELLDVIECVSMGEQTPRNGCGGYGSGGFSGGGSSSAVIIMGHGGFSGGSNVFPSSCSNSSGGHHHHHHHDNNNIISNVHTTTFHIQNASFSSSSFPGGTAAAATTTTGKAAHSSNSLLAGAMSYNNNSSGMLLPHAIVTTPRAATTKTTTTSIHPSSYHRSGHMMHTSTPIRTRVEAAGEPVAAGGTTCIIPATIMIPQILASSSSQPLHGHGHSHEDNEETQQQQHPLSHHHHFSSSSSLSSSMSHRRHSSSLRLFPATALRRRASSSCLLHQHQHHTVPLPIPQPNQQMGPVPPSSPQPQHQQQQQFQHPSSSLFQPPRPSHTTDVNATPQQTTHNNSRGDDDDAGVDSRNNQSVTDSRQDVVSTTTTHCN